MIRQQYQSCLPWMWIAGSMLLVGMVVILILGGKAIWGDKSSQTINPDRGKPAALVEPVETSAWTETLAQDVQVISIPQAEMPTPLPLTSTSALLPAETLSPDEPTSDTVILPSNMDRLGIRAIIEDASGVELAWSPDSQTLAVAGDFYQALDFTKVFEIRNCSNTAFNLDFSVMACATYEEVNLVIVDGGGDLLSLAGTRNARQMTFSPDGKLLAVSFDGVIKLYEVASGRETGNLSAGSGIDSPLTFSPDGSLLATTGEISEIKLLNVANGVELAILKGHDNWVNSLAFSPDGKMLASGSVDQTVRLWDVDSGKLIRNLQGHTGQVDGVAFSPDGRLLASVSWDLTIRLWQVSSGRQVGKLPGHANWIQAVAFSPDGTLLATASIDRVVRVWGLKPITDQESLPLSTSMMTAAPFPRSEKAITADNVTQIQQLSLWEKDRVRGMAWAPDGLSMALASYGFYFYDTQTDQETLKISEVQWVESIAYSPSGMQVATSSYDGIILWDPTGGGKLMALPGSKGTESVAFSPDGRLLASGAGGVVKLWDIVTGQELNTLVGGDTSMSNVAFSPDGRLIAGAAMNQIKLWEVTSGEEVATLEGHENWVKVLLFSTDGQLLISGSGDGTVRIWDVPAARLVRTIPASQNNNLTALSLSPDGKLLAMCWGEAVITIWDATSGKQLHSLTGHNATVTSLSFSPDGARLYSGSDDDTLRSWGLP